MKNLSLSPASICLIVLFGAALLIGQAPATAAAQNANQAGPFQFRYCRTGASYALIRFRVDNGESWYRAGDTWKKIEDAAPGGAGPYNADVLLRPQGGYFAIRFNHRTGQSWYLSGTKWILVKGP